MTEAPQLPALYELVDQVNSPQADAVRAVVAKLVNPDTAGESEPTAEVLPRKLPFIGMLEAEPDFAERSQEILDEVIRRNAADAAG